ncbi:type IX secretion system sortase PorU [Runella sp.]|uniref:type IX secretion system sortase PorU n=1 Tax=Runella sp. TaxID=1960881 RepID=UPI003D148AFB
MLQSALPGIAQTSVLNEGRLFKIGITQTGVYQLDAAFLRKIGVNPTEINPKDLRLFGNGGAMLPQLNKTPRATDLTENAVMVKGENDGRFDEGDALWFFGKSPHEIGYDSTQKRMTHQLNVYSDTTFYFLQIGTQPGLRIQAQKAGTGGPVLTAFDDYVFLESELYNRVQSGREWWGEYFGTQTRQEFNADLSGALSDSLKLTAATVASAQVATKFVFAINGQPVGEQSMGTVSAMSATNRYDLRGQRTQQTHSAKLTVNATAPARVTITATFDKAGQSNADGYIDFVGLQVKRTLRLYDQQTVFQNISSLKQDSVRYSIGQANAQMQLWDITDPLRPRTQSYVINGSEATFGTAGKTLKRFVVFAENQLKTPVSFQPIQNQSIRSLATPDMVIITAPVWQKQAQKLADFRQQNDGLEVKVVTTAQVYNEFSSGQPDPTAMRDLAKYLNNKQPNKLKYLLLFGDASYDFKNNLKALSGTEIANFVPTYESNESAHPVRSFSSDDYFGFLKPDDGIWKEDLEGNHTLDIGIGRLPVKTIEEAEAVVNKLIRYNSKRSEGNWRQRIVFVADDGDSNLHQQDADDLSKIVAGSAPAYNLQKVYVDAYPQSGSNSQRAPGASEAVDRYINEGAFIMNYTGHGGISTWSDEQIVTLQNLFNWRNLDNLPLIVTATCEFGRYDNPGEVSGAEIAVVSPRGGAIAMLSTSRPVYANTNFLVNSAFYRAVFQPLNGQMPRLGDVMKVTKNKSYYDVLNRNFTLLGDPSLRLNYGDYQVSVVVNDTLKAGRLGKLSGEIKQGAALATDFNGTAIVTVYDKESQLLTLGDQARGEAPYATPANPKMTYGLYNKKIFEGKVSVKAGKFSAQFIVPKDIDPKFGNGKVEIYAARADSLADAMGGSTQLIVGGKDLALNDTKPPVLQMYLNNKQFADGSQVEDSPLFIAELSDENGLNFAANMTVTLNDTLTIPLNNYFIANKDDYRSGSIQFPFHRLPAGEYTLKLKVEDTYNNITEGALRFRIGEEIRLIKNIIAYPNPFVERTNLQLELVDVGDDVEITVQIFDINGRIIRTEAQTIYNSDKVLELFTWDGTDHSIQNVPKGVYLYNVWVHSLTRQQTQRQSGKLIMVK